MHEEHFALSKIATIQSVNKEFGTMDVLINSSQSIIQGTKNNTHTIKIPYATSYRNNVFCGSLPSIGTQVIIQLGSGGEYFFVSFYGNNTSNIPDLEDNKYIIRNSLINQIDFTTDDEIVIGSNIYNQTYSNKLSNSFLQTNYPSVYTFTKASHSINGVIKRDLVNNKSYTSKINSTNYEKSLVTIGLDPSSTSNNLTSSINKNPALVENRSVVYEYNKDSDVESLLLESNKYSEKKQQKESYLFDNRNHNKSNVLSLGLNYPNHLMETILGTAVDTFGNVLDLNRYPIQLNEDNISLQTTNESNKDKQNVYIELQKRHRKAIAFHFELNAKKENKNIDLSSRQDKAKDRSRFFIDIDKEGQFKINIPSSSEFGNVPVLSRYENYSSFGEEDNYNPNKFIFREDNLDIFHDSFVSDGALFSEERKDTKGGSINIIKDNANKFPTDRILNKSLMHGTAHHDILSTCITHQRKDFLDYQPKGQEIISIDNISNLKNVVSQTLYVSGDKANAGGRSGQINLDGSLELNIGANTSDRQSLWLDTAGGIVGNVGRDLNNNSATLNMDGNLIMQVGNYGIINDTRFKENNGLIDAIVDLRVMTKGVFSHLIRIDGSGISIMTPGQLKIFAKQDITISSSSSLKMDAEQIYINGRLVDNKDFGESL